jgi:hypothetical protein
MSRTDYIARVQKGIEVYEAMEALTEENDTLSIEFGNRGTFNIQLHEYKFVDGSTRRSYSINDTKMFGKSMNIDDEKSTKSYLYCYSFDLFSNRTVAKLYFEHITIVDTVEKSL